MGNENFLKHDSNKIRVGLLEPDFILGVAEVATFGANKYAKDNWIITSISCKL